MRNTREQTRVAEFGAIVAVGFVAAVLVLYAFAWLADQMLDQETLALDLATLNFLQRFASPEVTLVAIFVSALGSEGIWLIGAVLVAIFAWQRRLGTAGSVVLVAAGAQILNDVLKVAFHRSRPEPLAGFIAAQSYSFPSGHAMVSAALYFYMACLAWRLVRGPWRAVVIAALITLVVLIGMSRLYLQAHYLSDVIAGYLAGFLWTDAVILGSRFLPRRHRA